MRAALGARGLRTFGEALGWGCEIGLKAIPHQAELLQQDSSARGRARSRKMRFGLLLLPTVPGTLEERERLRPIAAINERWQAMIKEIVEFARMAEDLGMEMVAFP